jgi:hypothetical protein
VGWLGIVTGAAVFVAALAVPLDDPALLLALAVLLRTEWLVFDGDNTIALVCKRKAPP